MTVTEILFATCGLLIGILLRGFLQPYLQRKGENLATKEDIALITRLQEEVKDQFARALESSKQRHSLRTIVAAERMKAHQEAFSHVKSLLSARDNADTIHECKVWADKNCLYLTPEARKGFWGAISAAETRAHYLRQGEVNDPQYSAQLHEKAVKQWFEIEKAFQPIVSGVDLPPIGDDELKAISGTEGDGRIVDR